jgi:Holliday junction resolvase RusA-like endonuclease
MTWMCEFRVFGDPKAQPRPRATRRGNHAGVYNPPTADVWKAAVVDAGRKHCPAMPLTGPLRVNLRFYFARPARLNRKKDPPDRVHHTAKPDLDNLAKAVLDAMTAAGWFCDDAQVCASELTKYYHAKGDSPGCVVMVQGIEQ